MRTKLAFVGTIMSSSSDLNILFTIADDKKGHDGNDIVTTIIFRAICRDDKNATKRELFDPILSFVAIKQSVAARF